MSTLVTFFIVVSLCLFPGINAYSRHHKNAAAIMTLTIVLGWTVLGWLVALVWSMTDNKKASQ